MDSRDNDWCCLTQRVSKLHPRVTLLTRTIWFLVFFSLYIICVCVWKEEVSYVNSYCAGVHHIWPILILVRSPSQEQKDHFCHLHVAWSPSQASQGGTHFSLLFYQSSLDALFKVQYYYFPLSHPLCTVEGESVLYSEWWMNTSFWSTKHLSCF